MSMYHALKISVLITSVLSVSSCTDHPLIQKNGRISSFNDIEQQFDNPSREYGTLPFFVWNGDITEDLIDDYMKMFSEAGCGGVIVHPRPGLITEYLSDKWFDLFRYTVEKGREYDMEVWIYDENSYPSGFAGGHVPDQMPESYNQGQGLTMHISEMLPDSADMLFLIMKEMNGRLQEITDPVGEMGKSGIYYMFDKTYYPKTPWYAGHSYVDLLYKGVTDKFLKVTMSGYEKACGDEFGKTIQGVFTDEPAINSPSGIRWTPDLFDTFHQERGYDLKTSLPSLFEETGNWKKVRHDYYKTLLSMFIERWSGHFLRYCEEKGLEFTGHYWEHSWPSSQYSPDAMAMYAWHHRPAIDMLFNQFDEVSPNAQFGNIRSVKELVSVANQMGRHRTLSETYGGAGWDLTFTDMKRLGDWEYALGVNSMNQHLAYCTLAGARKYDHPPSFTYHEPWWSDYRQLNLHFARLSLALSSGIQHNNILVIEPTTSAWLYDSYVKKNDTLTMIGSGFQKFITTLEKAQVEYDLGSEDIIARNGSVKKDKLVVGECSYSTVIIPPMTQNIESSTFGFIEEFIAAGGNLIAFALPDRVDGIKTTAIKDLFQKYSDRINLPDSLDISILKEMPGSNNFSFITLSGGDVYHHRRELTDGRLVFLANSSLEEASAGIFMITGCDALEMNTLTGKVVNYRETENGDKIVINFDLPPAGSLLLFVSDRKMTGYDLPEKFLNLSPLPSASDISVRRDKPNVLTIDFCDLILGNETFRNLHTYAATDKTFKYHGFINGNPWSTSVQFRTETVDCDTFGLNTGFTSVWHFKTEGEPDLSDARLVIERPWLWKVMINGNKVTAEAGKWWFDKDFGVYKCNSYIRNGENTITVSSEQMSIHAEIEPIYILGTFSLKSAARGWIITPPPSGYTTGSWKEQGMPFYPDRISYTKEFEVTGEYDNYLLKLGNWKGTIAEVIVNGNSAGVIAYPPYSLDISDHLSTGRNTIEVKIVGSNKNLLGPFHSKARPGLAAPGYWRGVTGYPRGDEYNITDYGLMDDFYLFAEKNTSQDLHE